MEIARALTLRPKFLLLDEPFTGIDPITIVDIQKILLSLKARGIGILLSDHNVRDTFRIADRAYIIDDGRILVEDVPEAVARHAGAREKFLGREFTFGEEREALSRQDRGEARRSPSVSPRKKRNRKKYPKSRVRK